MPDSPNHVTVEPSPLWTVLFYLWAGAGVMLMTLSSVGCHTCTSIPRIDRTFRFVTSDPRHTPFSQAQLEASDRWEVAVGILAKLALGYGLLGLLVFQRHGCVVFVLAAGVIVWCGWALLEVKWVPP